MEKQKGHLEFSKLLLSLVGAWLALAAEVLEGVPPPWLLLLELTSVAA